MPKKNEKTLQRFQIFDLEGNLLETVDIAYNKRPPNLFVVRGKKSTCYVKTMKHALQSAESLHLAEARNNGLVVKQVLI